MPELEKIIEFANDWVKNAHNDCNLQDPDSSARADDRANAVEDFIDDLKQRIQS